MDKNKKLRWYTVSYIWMSEGGIRPGGMAIFAKNMVDAKKRFLAIHAPDTQTTQITGIQYEGSLDEFHDRYGLPGQLTIDDIEDTLD